MHTQSNNDEKNIDFLTHLQEKLALREIALYRYNYETHIFPHSFGTLSRHLSRFLGIRHLVSDFGGYGICLVSFLEYDNFGNKTFGVPDC